ncbi:DUF5958 family protein [Streptomyces sp. B1I3]|uniref:DUF5958 family protein n=1 Tax=Streptomyces sp. B1I3 TaxID=3042264 RepID=UPI00278721A7|nr:DUF5958 family protein [Streptomyces sp. B1I3]MDQ0798248.1 hypothetical protein [Streptomyces sp. B1I3]
MNEWAIRLNELAQELRPIPDGIEWFEGLSPEEQFDVLRLLCQYCVQARANTEDGPESISRAWLRPTHTPAVLIARGRINEQLGKIAGLAPLNERRKAFRLLVSVLAIADGRRRERFCSNGCGHEGQRLSATGPEGPGVSWAPGSPPSVKRAEHAVAELLEGVPDRRLSWSDEISFCAVEDLAAQGFGKAEVL